MAEIITLALDAMGGDHAPLAIVHGAVAFLKECGPNYHVLLVGDADAIGVALAHADIAPDAGVFLAGGALRVVSTTQVIEMDEHPLEAVRRKPDSSLVRANHLVKDGLASATVSAGNTGAAMISAIQILGRSPGVSRPAIATFIPAERGQVALLVDGGANVDCRASHLVQFAQLGSLYSEKALGIERPRVGLLSNGEEESKGNDLVRETRGHLAQTHLNFIGSVEGNHVTEGVCDVVVCDGFAGNVLLKTAEGIGKVAIQILDDAIASATSDEAREAIEFARDRVIRRLDYAEYGGAPLLGVNGISIIAHGRSDYRAIAAALRVGAQAARSGFVAAVAESLKENKE